ncbi:MAG: Stp1/IreP family PP2C-type Ser/Thr phosphatase [Anaerolineales bacterium]
MSDNTKSSWGLDKGQQRDTNQDSLAAVDLTEATHDETQYVEVYAVADGMGGHEAGEVASKLAVQAVMYHDLDSLTEIAADTPEDTRAWLEHAIHVANQSVLNERAKGGANMGTTLVLAVVMNDHIHVANVGDSRAYLITAEDIHRITTDHSMAQYLVDSGKLTPEEARDHPRQNVLYNALGREEDISVDTFDLQAVPGDCLLLCSDGLWNELRDETIFEIVQRADTLDDACRDLVNAANAAGGRDNIAVVLARIEAPGEA